MRVLTTANLMAGDVVLFAGTGLASRLVRLLEGSSYSHAGIFDGAAIVTVDPGGAGIASLAPASCYASSAYAHVYRYISGAHKRLGADLPFNPVHSNVKRFQKMQKVYGSPETLLLGVLIASRSSAVPEASSMLRSILDEAADLLNECIDCKCTPVLSSELVYECFYDTQLAEYQIGIQPADPALLTTGFEVAAPLSPMVSATTESSRLKTETTAFLRRYLLAKKIRDVKTIVHNAGAERAMPVFVTPGDLAKSPNLVCVGSLHA